MPMILKLRSRHVPRYQWYRNHCSSAGSPRAYKKAIAKLCAEATAACNIYNDNLGRQRVQLLTSNDAGSSMTRVITATLHSIGCGSIGEDILRESILCRYLCE